jgi:hypothetical protein
VPDDPQHQPPGDLDKIPPGPPPGPVPAGKLGLGGVRARDVVRFNVMAFGTDRFVDHYLLSVIVAQETVEKVDTSVTQPYQ